MTTEIRVSDIELILAETALVRAGDLAAEGGGVAFGASPDRRAFKGLALDFLSALLKFPEIEYSTREADMRLRIALHFACPDAVRYDRRRPEPRWKLVFAHLRANFSFGEAESERLARLVAVVLDNWDARRTRGLENRRLKLLESQGYQCNCCHLSFADPERICREEAAALAGESDPFKPYFDGDGVAATMEPQVDHIHVVSRDGTNQSDNLQVLCALCNQGKADNSGVRIVREWEFGHLPIAQVPRGHRMSLLYYRLKMDDFRCTRCQSETNELSVRLVRNDGLVTLTNLRAICYRCLEKGGR